MSENEERKRKSVFFLRHKRRAVLSIFPLSSRVARFSIYDGSLLVDPPPPFPPHYQDSRKESSKDCSLLKSQ